MLVGRCPHCTRPSVIEKSNVFRPFCSERCKLLDLGDWMSGRFGIPAEADLDSSDVVTPDQDDPLARSRQ